ncbi:MAG TPA: BadF/BadG/BcrA/BcrD ATPase family protein [Candidatus Baltobacteraceae bacterium]|nr:BadF/BadG/BcrA/BcrD ATPase family protein [Candidatus Baltobacteraceae bacterium]
MPQKKITAADATYFLGFDGGGTKTECILADSEGRVVGRSVGGPSNPLRAGYMRAWFALSEAADVVLSRQKITASHIRGVCAGLGGAGRSGVARRAAAFFERGFPNAAVRVTTDLEIALEAAFGAADGIILLAGTGSAGFGRGENGKTARAGGRGPWFSDEGSAFDIGRRAFQAVVEAEEGRGPETALSKRIFKWHQASDWDHLLDHVSKNADDVFPRTFPLVAELAERGDEVSRRILSTAALSLANLAASVVDQLGWRNREIPVAKVGGVYGRSKHLDAAIEAELNRSLGRVRLVPVQISPAEAAARMAVELARAEGNAA